MIVSVLAIVVNPLVHCSRVRLEFARRIALAVQRAVLPQRSDSIGPLRIAGRYQAAVKEAQIGGALCSCPGHPVRRTLPGRRRTGQGHGRR
ncbi:hypothetical protein [Streptomyces roseochromogenus]|uniref:hypothetical protein n=1 Tax=Streptomyces roseochromogenus TaxID=285450 RepID=UPI001FD84F88|nr:hypothetical protein [Streptomyces roseochromogenus]